MDQKAENTPFHAGERAAQERAGVGDISKWASGFIRDYMPDQHRDFYASLPFLVLSGRDNSGATWVTLVDGPEGFIRSPDPQTLTLDTALQTQDPLSGVFTAGTDVGLVGIELSNRRRNRLSGHIGSANGGYVIDIRQTFGNCPQYIHERVWRRVDNQAGPAKHSEMLTPDQIDLITRSETMFIGSGHQHGADAPSRGFDASHRGGAPGFVQVKDARHLRIPDYAGNNFFNTIGNLIADPRVGLVFVDFETGSLLHVTGRANIDWHPTDANDDDAWRMIDVTVEAVIERPSALSLRWSKKDQTRRFKLTRRVPEAQGITSFHFSPTDGKEVWPFTAGQHLPISVTLPGRAEAISRSYSLSGDPGATDSYRLTIKREPKGVVSRFLHDALREGAEIIASEPAGDFTLPQSDQPVVLVSAGVGVTPMMAMLHSVMAEGRNHPMWFVHGARNGSEHALRDEVSQLVAQIPNAQARIFYSQPAATDVPGVDYQSRGRITPQALIDLNAGPNAFYLLCGPGPFLSDIKTGLEGLGVPAQNISYEVFGPQGQ